MRFFFGLLALFRNAVHLGFLDRPIVMGILFALLLEPNFPFLAIGIFFELLWLDIIPAGTHIPPQSQLAAFVCAETAALLPVTQPGQVLPLLLLAIPLAWLGSRVESGFRNRLNSVHDALLRRTASPVPDGGGDPQAFLLRSLALYVGIQACVCLVASMYLYSLGSVALDYLPARSGTDWSEILGGVLLGAFLALRLRRSYWLLAAGIVFIFMTLWL
ncbi:MAG: hypothetical protein K9J48_03005 [Desulfohalobiaceae bacterium]|nr:hypothetical protein [Desulfohalobiaceae bacterium]